MSLNILVLITIVTCKGKQHINCTVEENVTCVLLRNSILVYTFEKIKSMTRALQFLGENSISGGG